MTTVVLSPPSGPSSPPAAVPSSSKSVRMSVAVDSPASKTAKEAADASPSDSDSPTSTAIDLGLTQVEDDDEDQEEEDSNDDENVERRANGVSDEMQERPNKKRRRVSFECADIVEFEPTVYTTSVTSGGVPVGLSLNERSRSRRRLDSYEMERESERVGRQNYMEEGYLDPQEREVILNNAGCEEPVIASVEAEVNSIIQNRRESNEIDFDFMYGAAEMEDEEEEVEEEEEEVEEPNAMAFEQDGVEAEEMEEDGDQQEISADEEAAPPSTTDEDSVEHEDKDLSPETSVHPCSDDEAEAASI
ncbi:hypothetical protein PR003_g6751 [Phytophthora rubi]|uniref:Uncharacterized protein n=1 Tax=Phytophthora rubi TaxID=129364 RepID=A0A6A3N627_9STRA|nr:hypothetical protein PR002_g6760 [Phytophthora rubi]KAE9043045.1 hypothetical protein PR001_g5940 [Phytophthora rubi]KAE9347799.1 hypothetical protein PR003_g6751 [Phytophthora rubi]